MSRNFLLKNLLMPALGTMIMLFSVFIPQSASSQCLTCPSYDYSITPTNAYQATASYSIPAAGCHIIRMYMYMNTPYVLQVCDSGGAYTGDTYFELMDGSCNIVATNDDACGLGSRILFTPQTSGQYYLKVRGYSSSAFTYTLAYRYYSGSCMSCPSYNAALYPSATWQLADSLLLKNDSCYMYRIYMNPFNGPYSFTVCGDGGSNYTGDTYFELYDASCTVVASSDDDCGAGSNIDYTPAATGYYYLKVRGFANRGVNAQIAYKFTASCTTCPAYDNVITPTSAYQTISGDIGEESCDKLRVDMFAGYTYRFTFCEGGGTASYDTYLRLYDAGCLSVASNDDFCGLRSQLDYTPTVSGTYYLEVNSCCVGGSFGTYTLAYKYTYDPCISIVNIAGTGPAYTENVTSNANMGGAGWLPNACGFSPDGEEKMFQFTPAYTGNYNVVVTTAMNFFDYFYKDAAGGCNSTGWTCIGDIASPGTYGPIALTADTTYYFLLDDEIVTSANDHSFYIDYEMCANAITIPDCGVGFEQTYSSSGAGTFSNTACGYSTPGQEQIYEYTPSISGSISLIVTSSSGSYVDYFWKEASAGCEPTGWTCLNDMVGTGTAGSLTVTAGNTYLFWVDAESTAAVTQSFYLTCAVPPPANDDCANAIAIPSVPYTSPLQTTNGGTMDAPAGSPCGDMGINVWYTVVGTGNLMEVNTCDAQTNFDTELALYTGSCGSLTEIACNDDDCGASSRIEWCSTLGTTYYISVGYYWNGGTITGDFVLELIDYPLGTPAFTLGATSTRCVGAGNVTYDATATNSTGITYSLDATSLGAGCAINSGTGEVTYVAGYSGTAVITASAAGCNGPTTTIHTVTITPSVGTPVFTLGATSTRCEGAGNVTYGATATDNTGMTYSLDATSLGAGCTINSSTGEVTYVAGYSGTAVISVSATGCDGPTTADHTVTITPSVGTPVFAWGPASAYCEGAGNVTYSATATNNTGLTYSLDATSLGAGCTINSGTGEVTYVAGYNGTAVITVNATGCDGPTSAIHTVTITPSVGTPVFALGTTSNRCEGAGNVTYSATAPYSTGINYYLDATSLGAGNTINVSTGEVSYVVGWNGTSVITAEAIGCNTPQTSTHTVTITGTVGVPTAISGLVDHCMGTGINTATTTASDATGFNWSLIPVGAGTIGATDGVINWDPTFSGTATISVTANGCNGPSSPTTLDVDVFALPSVDLGTDSTVCADQSVTLDAGVFSAYLWSTTETSQSIIVDSNGIGLGSLSVWLQVTDANSCVNIDTIIITFDPCTGFTDVGTGMGVDVFPVPSSGLFNIMFNEASESDVVLEVMDVNGKLIYKEILSDVTEGMLTNIDLTGNAKGMYFLQILSGESSVTKKLLIH